MRLLFSPFVVLNECFRIKFTSGLWIYKVLPLSDFSHMSCHFLHMKFYHKPPLSNFPLPVLTLFQFTFLFFQTLKIVWCSSPLIGKGPQTFSTVFNHIAGDFGLVAQNPLTENGLLFMILSSSAVPVWDLIKTRIIKLFERKHWLRIYRSVIN